MKNTLIFVVVCSVAVFTVLVMLDQHTATEVSLDKPTPEIDYQVNDIEAVQTDTTGNTEYTLNAKSLISNEKNQQETLSDVNMDWEPVAGKKYTITSQSANFNQQAGTLLMNDGFIFTATVDDAETIVITGDVLEGDTKKKIISSSQPITFQQGENNLVAAALKADLSTGEYEFDRVEIVFNPTERVDEGLF